MDDWSYYSRNAPETYNKDIPYYVAYIDKSDKLSVVEVFVLGEYTEQNINLSGFKPHLQIKVKKTYFKRVPWYSQLGHYIPSVFVHDTALHARVAFISVMSSPSNMLPQMESIIASFSSEYPEIYLSKVLSYSGIRLSIPPMNDRDVNPW